MCLDTVAILPSSNGPVNLLDFLLLGALRRPGSFPLSPSPALAGSTSLLACASETKKGRLDTGPFQAWLRRAWFGCELRVYGAVHFRL